mmetsp:Transcript_21380/g.52333  ORF Transcript_21380/g.52333 Transcript_21380/m.52333 type:complete len:210 (+) Transcript_21380:149-778(+)
MDAFASHHRHAHQPSTHATTHKHDTGSKHTHSCACSFSSRCFADFQNTPAFQRLLNGWMDGKAIKTTPPHVGLPQSVAAFTHSHAMRHGRLANARRDRKKRPNRKGQKQKKNHDERQTWTHRPLAPQILSSGEGTSDGVVELFLDWSATLVLLLLWVNLMWGFTAPGLALQNMPPKWGQYMKGTVSAMAMTHRPWIWKGTFASTSFMYL